MKAKYEKSSRNVYSCATCESSLILPHLRMLICFFFLVNSECSFVCHPKDKKALLEIKADMNNNNASTFSNWNPETDCCFWSNTVCDENGRVVMFIINDADDVVGRLSPAVGDLRYLQALRLWNLPNLTGSIPSTIAKLTRLQIFEITSNNMDGPIPDVFGHLKSLQQLFLVSNKFSGSIPSSLSLPSKLVYLELSGNNLTGPVPATFGSFKSNLTSLKLYDNQLSGPIPKALGAAKIQTLDLSNNHLSGDASFLFGSDFLYNISLSNNKFKFDFSNVDLPQGLVGLNIAHNKIYGSLPKQLGQLSLQSIDVSYNNLCGKIPTGRRLKMFSSALFSHNKCLCGVPLPACK
ncbi:polygalacturonase inhibitor 2-like isoform X1 [Spinacia oleracea]|uniref:Polygalacturonase inhibitor 2-like isoform X1 n=1 Tax=Spinacia oleracea TaxID=3562 RepID=A0A9R0JZX3_SPIOL|nr:polygalacturonase inhibitor 2-like isoform X1 [Spinacia oleracea]